MSEVDTKAVTKELDRIRRRNGNKLRPADVVEAAKKPESPLHSHFTWDVESAAEQYWTYQARRLIKSIKVINPGYGKPERVFINVTKANTTESYYQNADAMTPDEIELAVDALHKKMNGLDRTLTQLRRIAEDSGDDRLATIVAIQAALSTANGLADSLH